MYSCGNKASQQEFEKIMRETDGYITISQFPDIVARLKRVGGASFTGSSLLAEPNTAEPPGSSAPSGERDNG